jgi:hypothetical protein
MELRNTVTVPTSGLGCGAKDYDIAHGVHVPFNSVLDTDIDMRTLLIWVMEQVADCHCNLLLTLPILYRKAVV